MSSNEGGKNSLPPKPEWEDSPSQSGVLTVHSFEQQSIHFSESKNANLSVPTRREEEAMGGRARAKNPCPHCGSEDTVASRTCLNCGRPQVVSGKALLHLVCHYLNFESEFRFSLAGRPVCPNCSRDLETKDSDFLSLGVLYYCQSCEAFEARAKIVCTCRRCLKTHENSSNLMPKDPSNEPATSGFGKKAALTPVFAGVSGWSLHPFAELLGKSGIKNSFSAVAMRSTLPYQSAAARGKLVVIDIVQEDLPIESPCVHSFFARALDCGVKHRIMIAIPKLDVSAKKLAESYGICLIEAPDILIAGDMIQTTLDKVLPPPALKANLSLEDELGAGGFQRRKLKSGKRSSVDIITDILKVALNPVSKSEIMACANMSYEQCQRYLPRLEKVDFVRKYLEDGVHARFQTTEKGREYISNIFGEFGTILDGERSVWSSKRRGL